MSEWRTLQMRDLMDEFHDGPHATPPPTTDGPVYLGIKNITDAGHLDLSDVRHISEDNLPRWTKRVTPQHGDVVFTYEATLHRYALIPEGFRGCLGRRLALIRPNRQVIHPRYLHYLLLGPVWRDTVTSRIISGSTVDRIPILSFPEFPVELPDLPTQRKIVAALAALDDLIENNRRRIELLERMAQAIYREWFVHFRYPEHGDATFADSSLGPIPEDWHVLRIEEVASADRHAVTGGPFGSKLGRKDYVEVGVPVIRGTNLRIGGGFAEKDYVFVSEDKAKELQSAIARPGDILITQRGTLGQCGLIPLKSDYDRYILSQSQMKITSDPLSVSAVFLYSQIRTPETTSRFIAQAMSSGVPHVNLSLLRAFEIVVPPLSVQNRFVQSLWPLNNQEWLLGHASDRLAGLRDLLLPKLVTGEIDVSGLDLDTVGAA